jgi:hypothetical protein
MGAQCSCTPEQSFSQLRRTASARADQIRIPFLVENEEEGVGTGIFVPAGSVASTLEAHLTEPDLNLLPDRPPGRELLHARCELHEATSLDRPGVPGVGVGRGHREHTLARLTDHDRWWLDPDRTQGRVVQAEDGVGDSGASPERREGAAARLEAPHTLGERRERDAGHPMVVAREMPGAGAETDLEPAPARGLGDGQLTRENERRPQRRVQDVDRQPIRDVTPAIAASSVGASQAASPSGAELT